MAEITINCDGIECENVFVFEIPLWDGEMEYGGDGHWLFCPNCRKEKEWFNSQCPGCVASFPDCGLGRSFMYSHHRDINENDIREIQCGICPFRVNGSFGFDTKTGIFEDINLSEKATSESGLAITEAIRRYMEKYN